MFLVVGQDSNLDGGVLDAIFIVGAREGVETVSATDSSPCGQTVLHDEQALLTVDIKVLGVADLSVLDDAVGLEETILGVAVVRLIRGVREHCVAIVGDREVATCGGKKSNKTEDKKTEGGKRDER